MESLPLSATDNNGCFDDATVLRLLHAHTYEEVSEMTGWSRGRIYALALKSGARKTENRIRERQSERRRRQEETLLALLNTTTKADVLDFLEGLPDNSVAAHISSPPYNLGKQYGECASADNLSYCYFHGWLLQIISEMARTVRPGGVVCLNVGKTRDWNDHLIPMDVMIFEDMRRAGLTFQSRIVWTTNHGLTPKNRLAERYETILVFSKGDTPTFNPNAARFPQKQPDKRAYKGPNKGALSGNPYGAFPSDVWSDIPHVTNNQPDKAFGHHPAQFPARLAKRLILLYTMAGDLISDCFSGSGSTQVGAIETGRAFVGADLFYEDLRAKRISLSEMDSFTPLPGVSDESVAIWQAEARRVAAPVARPVTEQDELSLWRQIDCFDDELAAA